MAHFGLMDPGSRDYKPICRSNVTGPISFQNPALSCLESHFEPGKIDADCFCR